MLVTRLVSSHQHRNILTIALQHNMFLLSLSPNHSPYDMAVLTKGRPKHQNSLAVSKGSHRLLRTLRFLNL